MRSPADRSAAASLHGRRRVVPRRDRLLGPPVRDERRHRETHGGPWLRVRRAAHAARGRPALRARIPAAVAAASHRPRRVRVPPQRVRRARPAGMPLQVLRGERALGQLRALHAQGRGLPEPRSVRRHDAGDAAGRRGSERASPPTGCRQPRTGRLPTPRRPSTGSGVGGSRATSPGISTGQPFAATSARSSSSPASSGACTPPASRRRASR